LLEHQQLLVGSAEHDPARWIVASQVPSERSQGQVGLLVARSAPAVASATDPRKAIIGYEFEPSVEKR
jgi:hypothetical protein